MKDIITTLFRTTVIALSLMIFGFSSAGAQQAKAPAKGAAEEAQMEHGHKGHKGGMLRILDYLDLTDAQKDKIKVIVDEQHAKMKPLVAELKKSREELRSLSKDGSFNEAAVRAVAVRQAAAKTELIVAKLQVKSQVFALLTKEQRAQAEKMLDLLRSSRHHGRNGGRDM